VVVFLILSIAVLVAIGILIALRWQKLRPYNQQPLIISTFDGLDSPFHPSVLFFEDGWNGWRYWMVETPFSPKCQPYVDRNECPSIHVSDDGINWETPMGLTNPLVNFGEEGEKNLDYYSDPHLVMANGRMECWYRLTERHGVVNRRDKVSLRRIYTEDGINWSKEEIISRLWENTDNIGLGKMVVSHALIYDAEFGYEMWYVNSENHHGERGVLFCSSFDGHNWINRCDCVFSGKTVNPWHIDVFKDSNGLIMTVYDENNLTLWESHDGINWAFVNDLLSPAKVAGCFYEKGLYRSCIVKDNQEYKLYFSAYDMDRTYIGLASFKTPGENISIFSSKRNKSFIKFLKYLFRTEHVRILFIIKNFVKHHS